MEQTDPRPDWVTRTATWVGTIGVVGLLVLFRWNLTPYAAYDAQHFVIGWYNQLERTGWPGLRTRFADYNVPYLYLLYASTLVFENGLVAIKVISNLADLVLAWGVVRVVWPFRGRNVALGAGLLVLLVPGIWINSAVWGQTDQIYTALAIHTLADLLRGKQNRAWFVFGLAFAFKLQAVFLLPFLVVVWLRDPRRSWAAPPLAVVAWFLTAVPALAIGLPWRSLLLTYSEQTSASKATVAPNLWRLFADDPDLISSMTAFAAVLTGALMVWALRRHVWFIDRSRWVVLAAAFAMLLPYTLPGMRNRYFFLAEALVLVAAVLRPRLWWVAVATSTVSALSYSKALFNLTFPGGDVLSGVPYGVLVVVLVRHAMAEGPDDPAPGSLRPAPAAPAWPLRRPRHAPPPAR
ncbi:glycosyltransferase family 39 protein [Aestuariimicrobium sp. T2.26MG-19.2B]|uniref:glycosyltransferase family 39 protein n=1 Tax=Aestuariimicrobium sp. T2.26MG-19.2B TaxID=3040679 RepID=UPI002540A871|nr:glycosyltransferase family 39 protein [Aestuariimicrobium sp. T2.26MG-19.2B]